jgi:hypothetical protein
MAYEQAVALANEMWTIAGHLAGDVVRALEDDKLGPFETIEIGLHAITLGSAIAQIVVKGGPQCHQDLLYVFEHATLVVPEEGEPSCE